MQQAYRCGSMCCMHSTSFFTPWCNLIAELSKSFPFWVHPLPAFQTHVPQYVSPWNWTWNSKMNTWRPLCKSSVASLAFRIPSSFSTVYSLHCIAVLPKDLDIPSATHQVFIARVLPVSVTDSLVIKIGDAANLGLWNAENSDNCQPPTTNSCRKCSEAARNNVKLWDIQPTDPSMVNILLALRICKHLCHWMYLNEGLQINNHAKGWTCGMSWCIASHLFHMNHPTTLPSIRGRQKVCWFPSNYRITGIFPAYFLGANLEM